MGRSSEAPKKEAVTFLESAPGSLTSGPHSRKRGHSLTWRSMSASALLMLHSHDLPRTQEGGELIFTKCCCTPRGLSHAELSRAHVPPVPKLQGASASKSLQST